MNNLASRMKKMTNPQEQFSDQQSSHMPAGDPGEGKTTEKGSFLTIWGGDEQSLL